MVYRARCVYTEFQALIQKAGLRCEDKCIANFLPQLHTAREIIRGKSVGSTILFPKNIKHSPQIAYKRGHHFDFKRYIMLLHVGLFMVHYHYCTMKRNHNETEESHGTKEVIEEMLRFSLLNKLTPFVINSTLALLNIRGNTKLELLTVVIK